MFVFALFFCFSLGSRANIVLECHVLIKTRKLENEKCEKENGVKKFFFSIYE